MLRIYLVFILIINLTVPAAVYSLDVRIKDDAFLNARSNDDGLHLMGRLGGGSILRIPDTYNVPGKDGRVDKELTLNNWLRQLSDEKYKKPFSNGKKDFFYPVEVVTPAAGSSGVKKGGTYQVALHYLFRKQNQSDPAKF